MELFNSEKYYLDIIKSNEFLGLDYKNREVYCILRNSNRIFVKILNATPVYVEYQILNKYNLTAPVLWQISDILSFGQKFLSIPSPLNIEITSKRLYGEPKLCKPKCLKNCKQNGNFKFNKNCSFPYYILNDDLYVKCRDYYSSVDRRSMGAPLSYRMQKYYNQQKKEKFIYPDCWGDIVLRNECWFVIKNLFNQPINLCVKQELIELWGRLHDIDWCYVESDYEWSSLFEQIAKITR